MPNRRTRHICTRIVFVRCHHWIISKREEMCFARNQSNHTNFINKPLSCQTHYGQWQLRLHFSWLLRESDKWVAYAWSLHVSIFRPQFVVCSATKHFTASSVSVRLLLDFADVASPIFLSSSHRSCWPQEAQVNEIKNSLRLTILWLSR